MAQGVMVTDLNFACCHSASQNPTAYHDAIIRGRSDLVWTYLQAGLKPNDSNIAEAILAGQDNILSLLLQSRPDLVMLAILELVRWNNLTALSNWLHRGRDQLAKHNSELRQARDLAITLGYHKAAKVIETYLSD